MGYECDTEARFTEGRFADWLPHKARENTWTDDPSGREGVPGHMDERASGSKMNRLGHSARKFSIFTVLWFFLLFLFLKMPGISL